MNIGEVYCDGCGDPFEPDGIPNFDEPNFCSEECYDEAIEEDLNGQAYSDGRYGAAPVF